jgi:hypothetical protein
MQAKRRSERVNETRKLKQTFAQFDKRVPQKFAGCLARNCKRNEVVNQINHRPLSVD